MKSFQFYKIESFPSLTRGIPIKNSIQLSLLGGDNGISTSLELTGLLGDMSLESLLIVSEVEYFDYGYTYVETDDGKFRRVDFTSYKHPVDFLAYLDRSRNIVILPQPKRICKKIFVNLNTLDGVLLVEMEVDFQALHKQCPECYGAWFRNLSTRVNVAGVTGNQIQEDELFKQLKKTGELSNVTIPWQYEELEHRLMITKDATLILQKAYNDNQTLELNVIIDAFDRLLCQVWKPKEKRRQSREYDIPVEP
jgi:hypothetical protein